MTLAKCPHCSGEGRNVVGKTPSGAPWHYVRCANCSANADPDDWQRRSKRTFDLVELLVSWLPIILILALLIVMAART